MLYCFMYVIKIIIIVIIKPCISDMSEERVKRGRPIFPWTLFYISIDFKESNIS